MKKLMALFLALLMLTGLAAAEQDDMLFSDNASGFVLLSEAVPDAILEIRYYSTYNFIGGRVDGYEEPVALLTKEAAAALKEVSDDLIGKGYRLKIYDAYRPQKAVTHFMRWALDYEDTRMKPYFYPELEKDTLFPLGYIAEHSGHSRGSTVDLTLFDMKTEKEADMGGTFDYFGELSHPDYTGITDEQYRNRMILRDAMLAHGFKPLEEEWWHFTLRDEPYPNTYFTFPVSCRSLENAAAGTLSDRVEGLHANIQHETVSPSWVTELPAAQDAEQLFIVAGMGMDQTTAYITMHERDENGAWKQILSTPGFVGRNGLCLDADHAEGCGQTPVGAYSSTKPSGSRLIPDARCPIFRRMTIPTGPAIRKGSTTRWSISGMCRIWPWKTVSTLLITNISISTVSTSASTIRVLPGAAPPFSCIAWVRQSPIPAAAWRCRKT